MSIHHEDRREQHVAQWRSSGLSRAAYCRKHALSYPLLLSWTKSDSVVARGGGSQASDAFFEVIRPAAIRLPPKPVAWSVASIVLPCGLRLRVAAGTDALWIGQVVSAVRSC